MNANASDNNSPDNFGGDIYGFETKYGKVVRWDKNTEDYAVGIPGVKISSLYPLRGGVERFEKLRERDEKKEACKNG
jgi:hypothetical protein